MMLAKFTRWGGLALLIGGAISAIALILHPDEAAHPMALLDPRWGIIHALLLVSVLFTLLGLPSLYLRQAEQSGWLGLIGFALHFVGTTLFGALFVLEAWVMPVLAADAAGQKFLDDAGPLLGGGLGLFLLSTAILASLGFILNGAAILRAGVFPRWLGPLIMIGGPLVIFAPPIPHLFSIIGGIAFGIAYMWIGYLLWTNGSEPARQFQQQMAHS